MSDAQGSPLAEAMNRLWSKFLPQMEQRAADAHKLAGVLGTFGLNEGTDLAREAESLYGGSLDGNPIATSRLRAIAEQLQAMIANHS